MEINGFVICLGNEAYSASLELHKVYAVAEPETNDPPEYVRVIDESGEDYLYPKAWFERVSFNSGLEARLLEDIAA